MSLHETPEPCNGDRLYKVLIIAYHKTMKERYGEITKQILIAVGVTGVVVLAAAAPGVLLAAKLLPQEQQYHLQKSKKKSVERSIEGLQKNRLLVVKEKNGKIEIKLTKKGKHKFREIQLEKLKITKPPHWDKKWRVAIFDIPDRSFKSAREVLRSKLKEWDFYLLQKSVWVCPWPCEDELQLIAELYGIAPYVNIIVAEKIFADTAARKHFGL
jgi:CRISPR/Cas system-associated endoribonuclease Cas2